jgi:chemotaxis protein methyltransferase CheR
MGTSVAVDGALFAGRRLQSVRLAGAAEVQAGVKLLRDDRAGRLHRAATEAMVVEETSFFRDAREWDVLRRVVLPRLVQQRAERMSGRRVGKLRVWSAACSTGQEAYSLAMLLCELPELNGWDVKIVATDSSQAAVEYARQGRYSHVETACGLPMEMLERYMVHEGEDWMICERVRSMCSFEWGGVESDVLGLEGFDLVLMRNVLLYFSDEERTRVFEEVWRRMVRGGCLMLGLTEQAEESTRRFEAEIVEGSLFYLPV